MAEEPHQAFPYRAPGFVLRATYDRFPKDANFHNERVCKRLFDLVLSLALSICIIPLGITIYIAQTLIGLICSDQRGPIIVSYEAVSRARIFKKYKFRTVRVDAIDPAAAAKQRWHAYSGEWNSKDLTVIGRLLKATYFDELPQLFNVIVGDMSMVGPRPLACHHYERDVAQGNVFRCHTKAGLFGPSQALKGSPEFGRPDEEFEYSAFLRDASSLAILLNDIRLMSKGVKVVLQAKGL